jgi:membrane-bound lytic murein transglycosylase B
MAASSPRAWSLLTVAAGFVVAATWTAPAAGADPPGGAEMRAFLKGIWPAARARGVSRTVFEKATINLALDPEVIEKTKRQPEFSKPTGAYVSGLVSDERIASGRHLAVKHSGILDAIEARYDVDRHVVLAIWGVESKFGANKGQFNVVRSLATLALADTRRTRYWRQELIVALRILQEGAVTPDKYVGSWAGAAGHTQFMPSAYVSRAVDFDGDGKRDIWGSIPDALGSAANYLRAAGWSADVPWGFEVALPERFDARSVSSRVRTLAEWRAIGVKAVGRRDGVASTRPLQLFLPAGTKGPAFLVSRNFRVLMRYNNSVAYALAVGHLADRIAGGAPLSTPWPTADRLPSQTERREMRALMMEAGGLDTSNLDGTSARIVRSAGRATRG